MRRRHHHHKPHNHCRNPRVSILIPFRIDPNSPHRARLWKWLMEYWSFELPDAEIIIADSKGKVFSKAEAVNNAARYARGRIFVILDADTYIDGRVVKHCADLIDEALRREHRLWIIPYRHLYRLTKHATEELLESDPRHPLRFHSPPPGDEVGSTEGSMHGHRFGAMIQIMPREAFELIGGMDSRFRGWGGEDVSLVRALDTMYCRHKTTNNDVLHLWHARIGEDFKNRMWSGQVNPRVNEVLASKYNRAAGDRKAMGKIIHESKEHNERQEFCGKLRDWLGI